MHLVVGQVVVLQRDIVVFRLPSLLTEHGGDGMLAEVVAVSDIVLQRPPGVRVLLHAAGVRRTVPGTQIHLWLVGLTL